MVCPYPGVSGGLADQHEVRVVSLLLATGIGQGRKSGSEKFTAECAERAETGMFQFDFSATLSVLCGYHLHLFFSPLFTLAGRKNSYNHLPVGSLPFPFPSPLRLLEVYSYVDRHNNCAAKSIR